VRERALIVGARGLGRELARHFAGRGWELVCAARTRSDVDALAREIGGHGVSADLADPASLRRLVADRGPFDLAVCAHTSGAPFRVGPVLEADPAHYAQRLQGSVLHSLHFLQAVAPSAKTVVQIGTTLAARVRPGFGALSSPQHALRALWQAAADELKPRGIHAVYLALEGQLATPESAAFVARHGEARAIPPQEVALALEYLHRQDPRAWTHELALRPAASE
jgi:NAD(P)-dependent dehydrogenase (short-subunit alcohol dehydrogenase family)